jgi:2-hydroxymuconate-semialdehyde hydrolase
MRQYDLQFGEYSIRCYEAGAGKPLLLLHGIGPGTSIIANFAPILGPLAGRFHVHACDFVGFGGSARKRELPYFDFDLWLRQAEFLLERVAPGPVSVLGHSMGGAIALKLARRNGRIGKVMTSGAAGGMLRLNRHVEIFWKTPRTRDDLREAMKVGMHDHSGITGEIIEERFRVIQTPGYSDYFEAMLSGDKQKLLDAAKIPPAELGGIEAEVLVMHGRNDLPCPAEETALEFYRHIPKSDLYLLARCGHAIPREYPEKVVALAAMWFG